MTAPVLGSKNIPLIFKAGLVLAITIILFPILDFSDMILTSEIMSFSIGVIGEIILGVIIGLSVRILFAGVQMAGNIAGVQMGFGMARVIDPEIGSQVSIIAQFYYLIAIMIFLAINAHYWFLHAVADSFYLVPPFDFQYRASLTEQLINMGGNMFVIALKVGAPVMAALLLTSVAFGLIARTVPQIHIMIVAFPVKILVGLLFLGFALPFLGAFFKEMFNELGSGILRLLT